MALARLRHLAVQGRPLAPYQPALAGAAVANADGEDNLHQVLAALMPRPRVNLARFHGVFAPNSEHRAPVTPARRGRGAECLAQEDSER